MKEKIREICSELNSGRIAVSQATQRLLDLFNAMRYACEHPQNFREKYKDGTEWCEQCGDDIEQN